MNSDVSTKSTSFKISGAALYEVAFIYCFTLSFLQSTLFITTFSPKLLHYFTLLGLGLILFKLFFLDTHSVRNFIFNIVILGILVITWRTTDQFIIMTMGVFIIGAREVDFRRLVRDYLIVGVAIMLVVIVSSELGVIKNLVYTRVGTHIERQSFGVVYPTDFAAHVVYLFLAYAYLRFKKISWISYFMMIFASVLIYALCDARFDALALLIMVPVIWIGKRAQKGYPGSYLVASFYWCIPVFFSYLTMASAIFYDKQNHIFELINKASSGRLALGHEGFQKYGVSLFGQHVVEHGWGGLSGLHMFLNDPGKYFFIDSAFIKSWIMYGAVIAILLLIVMTVISWRSVQTKDFALASILVIVTLSAVIEQHMFELSYDPFLLAMFANVYVKPKLEGEQS